MFSFSLTFKNIGLPLVSLFSFNEDYLMNITCPYCYSANVSRATSQPSGNNSFSSMAGAGLVQALPKVCLHHFHHYWVDKLVQWWVA
jgi:hypothetical protein